MIEYYLKKIKECKAKEIEALNKQDFANAHYWQDEIASYEREVKRKLDSK